MATLKGVCEGIVREKLESGVQFLQKSCHDLRGCFLCSYMS
jgi:hypothetical protein